MAEIMTVGNERRGSHTFVFWAKRWLHARQPSTTAPRFEQVAALADAMMKAYAASDLVSVNVCYMRFISTSVQRPWVMQLLPLEGVGSDAAPAKAAGATRLRFGGEIAFDYEPAPARLLAELLPATVRMRLFQCFTEAAASEQVARMVAMKAATDAAEDMIKLLTQQYNRARQTAITMELLDIIGGGGGDFVVSSQLVRN